MAITSKSQLEYWTSLLTLTFDNLNKMPEDKFHITVPVSYSHVIFYLFRPFRKIYECKVINRVGIVCGVFWWEWHDSFLLFHPHKHGHFWQFFTIQSQQTTTMFFILKVLRYSNNLGVEIWNSISETALILMSSLSFESYRRSY